MKIMTPGHQKFKNDMPNVSGGDDARYKSLFAIPGVTSFPCSIEAIYTPSSIGGLSGNAVLGSGA
jgi:hypothetical protein